MGKKTQETGYSVVQWWRILKQKVTIHVHLNQDLVRSTGTHKALLVHVSSEGISPNDMTGANE